MLTFRIILALAALGAVAARPRSWAFACGAGACAALALVAGAGTAEAALVTTGPPIAFLASVMGLALLADHSGLAARLAALLAVAGRGRVALLFGWTCAACALLTAALSLDGAVVVMLPVIAALVRSHGAPLRPLLLGTVGVANCFSAALPAGNPTNLVVMARLGLSPGGFAAHMLLPSLGATLACVSMVWLLERRRLAATYRPGERESRHGGRPALIALGTAALADWTSPLVGLSPWIPVSAVAVIALAAAGRRPLIALPLRTALQIGSLLVVLGSLKAAIHIGTLGLSSPTLGGLALVAVAVTAGAALANNLPASAAVATLLAPGPGSYAALLGLSAGALATPHGSVATLVSLDMAPGPPGRGLALSWAAAALVAVCAGVVVLRLTAS